MTYSSHSGGQARRAFFRCMYYACAAHTCCMRFTRQVTALFLNCSTGASDIPRSLNNSLAVFCSAEGQQPPPPVHYEQVLPSAVPSFLTSDYRRHGTHHTLLLRGSERTTRTSPSPPQTHTQTYERAPKRCSIDRSIG